MLAERVVDGAPFATDPRPHEESSPFVGAARLDGEELAVKTLSLGQYLKTVLPNILQYRFQSERIAKVTLDYLADAKLLSPPLDLRAEIPLEFSAAGDDMVAALERLFQKAGVADISDFVKDKLERYSVLLANEIDINETITSALTGLKGLAVQYSVSLSCF